MSWGPEKLLIRCSRESQQSEPLGLPLSSPGEWERHNADGHKSGGQYIAVLLGLQLPLTIKPWITFLNPYNKVRGIFFIKKSSLVCYLLRRYVSSIYMWMWICIWLYNITTMILPTLQLVSTTAWTTLFMLMYVHVTKYCKTSNSP